MFESMDQQLKLLPQWAKSISQFNELDIDDQVSLLRASKSLFLFLFFVSSHLTSGGAVHNFNVWQKNFI